MNNLFSRSSTPPQSQHQSYSNPQQQQPQPQRSSSSPNHIDSLFNNISAHDTTPTSPLSTADSDPVPQANRDPAVERASALLSLLGSVPQNQPRSAPAAANPHPQQIPTPPGSSQRSAPSPNNNESQGKILLEQLMAGNTPRSNYTDTRSTVPPSGPSPPYPLQQVQGQRESDQQHSRDPSYVPQDPYQPDTPRESTQRGPLPQPPQPLQQQPPSPPRKSMFDFVSAFDAFPSSSSSSVKKKPVPPTQPPSASSGNEESWTSVSVPTDSKRKSVENLIDQLTRGQAPLNTAQDPLDSYDSYISGEDLSQNEPILTRPPPPLPPLPPKPPRAVSPRASPPKTVAQHRPIPRSAESPASQSGISQGHNRRDKESSPGPRGTSWKPSTQEGRNKSGPKAKNHTSPSSQAQSIIFDVSQPLTEIHAPPEHVKSTAIALVRQDPVFLPGTTIGATHWVAYAMTKGRVRVISRSSGDRTLLQLPPKFPSTTSIIDMAVFGNRLAGVTSDGGFVVWGLPEIITDDVPGELLLCVAPSPDSDALHSVKWHPKQPDTLAVASETRVYVLDLADAAHTFRGELISQGELNRIGQVFSVSSRLIAFDFDVPRYAIASISEDSTLVLWNVRDKIPFWTHKVRGDDVPSSLTFVDDGIVVGRKNGTIFQLLSATTKSVLSTVKFVNGTREDPDMFGHVNYDSRIQTLWIANSRRESVLAFKIGYETSVISSGDVVRGCFFEQVVEFTGPKSTIHFVILSADADPNGDEAHAACVAAKVPPSELALVAFSVHSTGVDQILIRKEWFDNALLSAAAKYPPYIGPSPSRDADAKGPRQSAQVLPGSSPLQVAATPTGPSLLAPARLRTPPSEEVEDVAREDSRLAEKKGGKGKNVLWKDKDDVRDKNGKTAESTLLNDSVLGQALSKEIRKSEESLHTRIGRLIGKEMDKQHQRFEDARAHEQAEDFARQEKILKLISNELTRNTTRVVEMAVKGEVQNSVLPALENIMKAEVKLALNEQIGRGFSDFIQGALPIEIEKLLLRPDVSSHFSHILSSNLTPLIDRYVKDAINKNFMATYSQQSSAMHQEVLLELRSEMHNLKKDMTSWQNETIRNQESAIRDLELSVRALADQVKFLTMNSPAGSMNLASSVSSIHHQLQQSRHSPSGPASSLSQPHLRQANHPPINQGPVAYNQSHPPFQQQQTQSSHGQWFGPSIAAPQASHPLALPAPPPLPAIQRTPPSQSEDWDGTYLAVLVTQNSQQLCELLSRSNPEIVMPLNEPGPLSQAVVLTLLFRLAVLVNETPPVDEIFKSTLWWLQRTASVLNPNDTSISHFISRIVPNVQQMLTTTKQRLAILPGGLQHVEASRIISEIQETLKRKPLRQINE